MNAKRLVLPIATAGFATVLVAGAVAGQDPDDEPTPTVETRHGTIDAAPDADGAVEYRLTDANGTVDLSVGPRWFWTEGHPLDGLSGEVTVTGELDDGTPPDHANAANRADGEPSFEVHSVNGEEIRAPGKPPWAGGPAQVGENHPGYAGWARGQANSGNADE